MERRVYHDGNVLLSVGTKCTVAEGRTRQSEAKQSDVNVIVARFDFDALNAEFQARVERGEAPWKGVDVSEVPSFQAALDLVRQTEEYFMRLPAEVRTVFGNNAAAMVDAWNAQEHREVFERIGLLREDEEAKADAAESRAEARAEKRRLARDLAKRVEAAKSSPAQ